MFNLLSILGQLLQISFTSLIKGFPPYFHFKISVTHTNVYPLIVSMGSVFEPSNIKNLLVNTQTNKPAQKKFLNDWEHNVCSSLPSLYFFAENFYDTILYTDGFKNTSFMSR